MSANKYAVLLTMSVLSAYLYLQIPALKHYYLQAFALASALYLLFQKRQRGRFSLVLPENNSANLALLSFAVLLLVGASGALSSVFFAVTFIYLFFLALSVPLFVALLITLEVMAFYFSMSIALQSSLALPMTAWSNLVAIPVVMMFYLFARAQYEKAYQNSLLMKAESRELLRARSDDEAVNEFVTSLINKRLPMLEFLLSFPAQNKTAIDSEIVVLKRDLNVLLRQIEQSQQSTTDSQSPLDTLVAEAEKEAHEKT